MIGVRSGKSKNLEKKKGTTEREGGEIWLSVEPWTGRQKELEIYKGFMTWVCVQLYFMTLFSFSYFFTIKINIVLKNAYLHIYVFI